MVAVSGKCRFCGQRMDVEHRKSYPLIGVCNGCITDAEHDPRCRSCGREFVAGNLFFCNKRICQEASP